MTATLSHREPHPSLEETSAWDLPRPRAPAAAARWGRRVEDKQFLAMAQGYRRSGGLAGGDEVARLLHRRSDQPISVVARWIVDRRIVTFVWQSQTLIPMFQFDMSNVSLRRGVPEVVEELSGVFDDWELASWFVHPNCWLHDAAPADVIADDPAAVLRAARADRFIARG